MKELRTISSYLEPENRNVLWLNLNNNQTYRFYLGEWKPIDNLGEGGGNGTPGQDGVSPTVSINKVGKVTEITITDVNGTHTATINDGADGMSGESGKDGVSPTIQAERVSNGVKLTITDKNGSHSAVLNDGISDGSTVSTFADVPSDGKSYLRQNGTWVEGATKAELNNLGAKVGELEKLETDDKNSIVNAINEHAERYGKIENNPEFIKVETDSEGNLIEALTTEGKKQFFVPVEFMSDILGNISDSKLTDYYTIDSIEWTFLILDANDTILFGIKNNGTIYSVDIDTNFNEDTITDIKSNILNLVASEMADTTTNSMNPLDKLLSLSSGISDEDIENRTSKYDEIAQSSSNKSLSKKASSLLYNLFKLEKENIVLSTFFTDIDFRNDLHEPNFTDIYRISNGDGTFSPKEPDTFDLDSFSFEVSGNKPLIYIADFRWFTDITGYDTERRNELYAIMLSVMKKAWVDYKAIPVMCWHSENPYKPANSKETGYNYRYVSVDYPLNHRFVINEIINNIEYGQDDGAYPSNNNTICSFSKEFPKGRFTSPRKWFDYECEHIGNFIKELYEFIGEEIPMIIRLWHECEDNWQWWGTGSVSVEDYKQFFNLTVDNIKRYSSSNSLLFGYCTDKNIRTSTSINHDIFELRYPGDENVDIVGFDDYSVGEISGYAETLEKLRHISAFALKHKKPAFVWETGNKHAYDDFYNKWNKLLNEDGVHFSALMGWNSFYPPGNRFDEDVLEEQMRDFSQFYKRSNLISDKNKIDLTIIKI